MILDSTILNLLSILNSAILHKTLTQTSSIWFKLIHSHLTWWWQSSWIWPCSHLYFILQFSHTCQDCLHLGLKKNLSLISFWLNLIMTAILNSAILDSDYCILGFKHLVFFSLIHSKALSLHSDTDSNSFILTQLDDGSHLEFCHVGFRHCHLGFKHLVILSQIHSKTLTPLWLWLTN